MLYTLFYLLTVADKLSILFGWLAALSSFFLLLFSVIVLANSDSEEEARFQNTRFIQRSLLFLCPLFWLLFVGTPTKKEAVLIVAGGYIGNFIQSDSNARALPADITRFLRAEINQAAREADLGSILEPTKIKEQRDSLSNLSKEQLVEGLLKKE